MTAVILAAGRGTRMQYGGDVEETLTAEQAGYAARGLKTLIPFDGRAFIEYLLDEVAAAGISSVCVVTGPHTAAVRTYLEQKRTDLRVAWAHQREPRGSADALLAAEAVVAGEPFLVLNADNLYPADDLRRLATLGGPGLIGYSREGLIRGGIPASRIAAFALIETDASGALRDIIEKPDTNVAAALTDARVSMTCWRFDARVFDACRRIGPSPRGELEVPDAVRMLIARGVRFEVLPSDTAVADLSTRGDVVRVAAALKPRH